MFCKKCGLSNGEQAKFCKGCGNALSAVAVIAPATALEQNFLMLGGIGFVLVIIAMIKTTVQGYVRSEAPLYFIILAVGAALCYFALQQLEKTGNKKDNLIKRAFVVAMIISAPVLVSMLLKYIIASF